MDDPVGGPMHEIRAARPEELLWPFPALFAQALDLSTCYKTWRAATVADRRRRGPQHGSAAAANEPLRVTGGYGFVARQANRREDEVQECMEHGRGEWVFGRGG